MVALVRILIVLPYVVGMHIFLLLCFALRPFHRDNVFYAAKLYAFVSKLMGLDVEVRLPKGFDPNGPYVFISNHQNTLDLFTVTKAIQPHTVSIGKTSLAWIPFFGQIYWLSGNILINRKRTEKAQNSLDVAAKQIHKKGLSIWVFPEGTRSYGRGLLPFKTGAFRLARSTDEAIVPVTVTNLHNKVRWNRLNNGKVIIELGEPVQIDDSRQPREWADYFHKQMQQRLLDLDAQVAEQEKAG